MVSSLRWPTFAVALLSIGLSIAVIGCAARTIHVFSTQQSHNQWLLPIWPDHFDTRELRLLIGTSTSTIILNCALISALFISSLPANIIILASSLLGAICSMIAIIFTATLNSHAPKIDTLQSWTCRWSDTSVLRGAGAPGQFNTLCNETRFAFYATIPLFLLQLLLLALAFSAMTLSYRNNRRSSRLYDEPEKGLHELGDVRNQSFETKSERSLRSNNYQVEIVAAKK